MKNRLTRGHIIEEKFEIAHFIEQTSFCQIYSLKGKNDNKLYTLNPYNAAKIARDDLDKNGKLLEIGFLKMRIKKDYHHLFQKASLKRQVLIIIIILQNSFQENPFLTV